MCSWMSGDGGGHAPALVAFGVRLETPASTATAATASAPRASSHPAIAGSATAAPIECATTPTGTAGYSVPTGGKH